MVINFNIMWNVHIKLILKLEQQDSTFPRNLVAVLPVWYNIRIAQQLSYFFHRFLL